MAAFAVDVAWMQLVRTELRTATDSAARAGAKELSLAQDQTAARQRAKEAGFGEHLTKPINGYRLRALLGAPTGARDTA